MSERLQGQTDAFAHCWSELAPSYVIVSVAIFWVI
jgi:hypothetical protein